MRIALVHTRLLLRGGLETRLFSYMRYLRDLGHEVTVIVYKVGQGAEVEPGVKLLRVPMRWVPKPFRAWVFDRKLKKVLADGNFDFVLSLGRTTHHDAVIVAGVHRAFNAAMGRGMWRPSDWIQAYMDERCYRSPGWMLPASEMIAQQMTAFHHVETSRIKVLYPPTNPRRFHRGLKANRDDLREKHGMAKDKFTFLFISSNHMLKGLDVVMDAFAMLPDGVAELVVVGHQDLPRAQAGVRSIGFLKETEELYAAADCSLLASRYDAFGQVVTESLLCGTPVIVSAMTGAKVIVKAQDGIVVDSMNPSEWAEAMRIIMAGGYPVREGLAESEGLGFEAHMDRILELARPD
jgi:glycosyltransferase involved in cell wall biosynthesis